MPEPFDRLRRPDGLSSMEILWVWLEVRIEREKVEISMFASERGLGRATGAHLGYFSLALFDVRRPRALRGLAFEPRPAATHIE